MSNPPKFTLDTKTIFLTIPQTDLPKETAYDRIMDKYKDKLNCLIVSHEKHKDDGDHLHIYMNFKERFRTKAQNIFDFIADKHPNIQSAKSPIKVIKYVCKDGDYINYNINVLDYMKEIDEHKIRQSKGQFYELSQAIKDGIKNSNLSLKDLNENYGELFIKYGDHIKKYISFCENLNNVEDTDRYYKELFENITFNPLQQYILDLVDSPKIDNRTINWIYDPIGNNGKSTIANYLEMYKGAYIITGGKHADIYRHFNNNKVVIYDLPRDYIDTNESIYSTMETFKNGYCLDTKYEGQKKRFIPPHIVVFSNSKPNLSKLSLDRWNVIDMTTHDFNRKPVIESKADIIEEIIEPLNNADKIINEYVNSIQVEPELEYRRDELREDIKKLIEYPKIHNKRYLDTYLYNAYTDAYYTHILAIWLYIPKELYIRP